MIQQVIVKQVSERTGLPAHKVSNTIELLEEGSTVPFISRYRKEKTGSLNEVDVSDIKDALGALQNLIKRKDYILKTITGQGQLTDQIQSAIQNCWNETALEDLYLPFKKKKSTKASMAKEKGLETLAKILEQEKSNDVYYEAGKFLSELIHTEDEALEGARHILAEYFSENIDNRNLVRKVFYNSASLTSKVVKSKISEAAKYKDYFDFAQRLDQCPSHRVLAIFRGAEEGVLRQGFDFDIQGAFQKLVHRNIKSKNESSDQKWMALEDALQRLLKPSLENEIKKDAKLEADLEAIGVFATNLRQLLLAPPLGSKRTLAIDPGFRTGCKVVCLDKDGELLSNSTIYPHPPQSKMEESRRMIYSMVFEYDIEAIAVGNGTAGRETTAFIQSIDFEHDVEVFMVNENGASIYSASQAAREEFPDLDLTVRGAISIGRRLMDPLAELVKIDPKSIGVGQYQHDVDQKLLKNKLTEVVELCVNSVGINLNTASFHLLQYVSGLGPVLAKNIIAYRSENGLFKDRRSLMHVPRMGAKAYQLAVGFLRVRDGKNKLDQTGVHPERYELVNRMAKDHGFAIEQLIGNKEKLQSIDLRRYTNSEVGLPTLNDIVTELQKPGLDPRGQAESFSFTEGIRTIDDLNAGIVVNGVINNITKFGAFVDIGIKESGLIHISELANKFVQDPNEVVKLNQKVKVKVLEVDIVRARISLSIKQA